MDQRMPPEVRADYGSRAAFIWRSLAKSKKEKAAALARDDVGIQHIGMYLEAIITFAMANQVYSHTLKLMIDENLSHTRLYEHSVSLQKECINEITKCERIIDEAIAERKEWQNDTEAWQRLIALEFERRLRRSNHQWLLDRFNADPILSSPEAWGGARFSWTLDDR